MDASQNNFSEKGAKQKKKCRHLYKTLEAKIKPK